MRTIGAIIVTCFTVFPLWASADPDAFLFDKALIAPDSFSSEVGVFRLDSDIYRGTDDNFADLRIFDAGRKEIPFLIRPVTVTDTDTVHFAIDIAMENRIALPENRMELIFPRGEKDSIPTELVIATPLVNFEKCVTVYGSDDKKMWQRLSDKQPIFDYSQYVDVRNTTVSFNRMKCSYYKIVIDNVSQIKRSPFCQIVSETEDGTAQKKYTSFVKQQEPFRLESVSFYGYAQNIHNGERQKNAHPLTILSSVEDTAEKLTTVLLSSNREPLNKLILSIRDSNFRRPVIFEGTNDTVAEPQWQPLASSEIYNIKASAFSRERLEIDLGGSYRYLRYRLKIINRDNAPVRLVTVSAEGDAYEVLFFPRDNHDFKVVYGCAEATLPQYDVASVLENAPVIKSTLWKLGTQVNHVVSVKETNRMKPKYFLFGSLFLMVIILAGILFKMVGKVEESTDAENVKKQ